MIINDCVVVCQCLINPLLMIAPCRIMPIMNELKRVTFLLPENYYNQLVEVSEQKAEAMSSIARRLIIEWLEANPPKPGPKSDPPAG